MSDPASHPDDRPAPTDRPAAPPTVSYDATPLAGPTAPYDTPAVDPAAGAVRPRCRRGLLIGGVAAASLLMLGMTFGGGVVLGAQLGGPGRQVAFEEGGFPGGDRPAPPDGVGPGQGDQGFPGGQDGQSDDDGSMSEGGAAS